MISVDQVGSLALFARVVQHRSFSAAAREAGLAKSAVSRRIAELERTLGVRLLHRTTRTLSLTEEGVRVHEHARALVAVGGRGAGRRRRRHRGRPGNAATQRDGRLLTAVPHQRRRPVPRAPPGGGGPPVDRRPAGGRGGGRLRRGVPHRAADRLEPGRAAARHGPPGGLRLAGVPRAGRDTAGAGGICSGMPACTTRSSRGRPSGGSARGTGRSRSPPAAPSPAPTVSACAPRSWPVQGCGRPLDAGRGGRGSGTAPAGARGSTARRVRHSRGHRAPDPVPPAGPGAARLPGDRLPGPRPPGHSPPALLKRGSREPFSPRFALTGMSIEEAVRVVAGTSFSWAFFSRGW